MPVCTLSSRDSRFVFVARSKPQQSVSVAPTSTSWTASAPMVSARYGQVSHPIVATSAITPSVAVDNVGSIKPCIVARSPIIISDDSVDTQLLGDALGVPEEDLAGFGDVSFGLDSAPEGCSEGGKPPLEVVAVETAPAPTLMQAAIPVEVPVSQDCHQ